MQEINFYHLMKFYAKRWRLIITLSLIGFIGGLIYNGFIQTPQYKSNATLIIIQGDNSSTTKNSTLINNYIELFKSRKVLEPTISDLKLDKTYEELSKSISATNDNSTEVVKLSVSSNDPKKSKRILNYAIDQFEKEGKKIYHKDNIQIVDSASIEDKPYNVNAPLQLSATTVAGFVMAIVIIFFIYDYQVYEKLKDSSKNNDKKDIESNSTSIQSNNEQPAETTWEGFGMSVMKIGTDSIITYNNIAWNTLTCKCKCIKTGGSFCDNTIERDFLTGFH